jgi:DNA-binding transcriptional ArsR family regulator
VSRGDAFGAVADPTRRAILELLRDRRAMTAGDIAAQFPSISRPAVSKHLSVLLDAELVHVQEQGRERHYSIDVRPLVAQLEAWLLGFAPMWDRSLPQLKRAAERSGRHRV